MSQPGFSSFPSFPPFPPFPSGLYQPPGAYRFSADALYLAHFAATAVSGKPAPCRPLLMDLGTGCGIAALAALRLLDRAHGPVWRAVGVDCQPCMIEAARMNAAQLGLAGRFAACSNNLTDLTAVHNAARCAQARLIVCNPPWRLEGHGLVPPSPVRRKALFGTAETLPLFACATARLLAPDGIACFVIGAGREEALQEALHEAGLWVRLALPVSTRENTPAPFVLLEATHHSRIRVQVPPPHAER